MRFFDLIPLFRKRAAVSQSGTDLSVKPTASQIHTAQPSNNTTHTITVGSINWDPGVLYDRPDRSVQGVLNPVLVGYHDGFGYRSASHAHPLPVSGSQILYRAQLVRCVPNWHPLMSVIPIELLALISEGRRFDITRERSVTSRLALLNYLIDKVEDGYGAIIFPAMGGVNPFAKIYPRFPIDWVAFSFPEVKNPNLPIQQVRFYQPPNASTNLNGSNAVWVDVPAPRRYTDWLDNTGGDYHAFMKMLYTENLPSAWDPNVYGPPMAIDRLHRRLNRASMVYTGGRYKHYRLIVVPAAYGHHRAIVGAYAVLYAGMGAAFRNESNSSETYNPTYGATECVPFSLEHEPIGVGWDIRREASRPTIRRNNKLFVIDFKDDDYRGIEYLSISLGLIGFDPAIGRVNCLSPNNPDLPDYQPTDPSTAPPLSDFSTLDKTGESDIGDRPTDPIDYDRDRDEVPDSCIEGSSLPESELINALASRPWSNLDFEIVARWPDPPRATLTYITRQTLLTSAYVYLVGLES